MDRWKLKQAEYALNDGRLDEAFDVLQDPTLREQHAGQQLVGRLAQALVARGRGHFEAGHWHEALADCRKAEQLAGRLPEIVTLRVDCEEALARRQAQQARQRRHLMRAEQCLRDGRLSGVQQWAGQIEDDQAQQLLQEAGALRADAEAALQRLDTVLAEEDLAAALDLWRALTQVLPASHGRCLDTARRLRQLALKQLRQQMAAGRLDRCESLLGRLTRESLEDDELWECREFLETCRRAGQAVAEADLEGAVRQLGRLRRRWPQVGWVEEAWMQARRAQEDLGALATGPLGWAEPDPKVREGVEAPIAGPRTPSSPPRPTPVTVAPPAAGRPDPGPWLLQIDGVGTFPLYAQNRLVVGPVSGAQQADVRLLCGPDTPAITLERIEDDLFVRSQRPVRHNQQDVTRALLGDGDVVALSHRCRLRVNQPNAASTTATLSISGARLERPDIRLVVLLHQDLVIGPERSCHIRVGDLERPIVLVRRSGGLICRSEPVQQADGRVLSPETPLPRNRVVKIGSLSMVLTPLGT